MRTARTGSLIAAARSGQAAPETRSHRRPGGPGDGSRGSDLADDRASPERARTAIDSGRSVTSSTDLKPSPNRPISAAALPGDMGAQNRVDTLQVDRGPLVGAIQGRVRQDDVNGPGIIDQSVRSVLNEFVELAAAIAALRGRALDIRVFEYEPRLFAVGAQTPLELFRDVLRYPGVRPGPGPLSFRRRSFL